MLNQPPEKEFRVRSFVGRNSRTTRAQAHARDQLWSAFGLDVTDTQLQLADIFGNQQPCYLEIGFGMGQTLLAAAQRFPEANFIGVEPHQPGVGSLLMHASVQQISNLRVFNADVIDVLQKCIPDTSLTGVQVFFPDPWQKRRHHERRLVQPAFLDLLTTKLKPGGTLHLATDWEDYSIHMMKVLSAASAFKNLAGYGEFAQRSCFRPIISKFEQRAIREGRAIWELQFIKE